MKKLIIILIWSSTAMLLHSQSSEVEAEKCTEHGILSDIKENGGVLIRPKLQDYISNWNLTDSEHGEAYDFITLNPNFKNAQLSTINPFNTSGGINSLSESSNDSTKAFSLYKNGFHHLYITHPGQTPVRILKGTYKTQYLHPFITAEGDQVYFSSNSGNQINNYDIFLINKLKDGWSNPIRLNYGINTSSSQTFPTFYDDTLFYSSNKGNGLDIYASAKRDQFKTSRKLGSPFNSDQDDFLVHKKNNQLYYITSNRENSNNYPFRLTRKNAAVQEKMLITGYLACSGNRISNIPISLEKVLGAPIDNDITDANGNFILRSDKQIRNYKLKLDKKDVRIKDCAVLYITDKDGNVVQMIRVNEENEFIFELIDPDDVKSLKFKSIEDESLLQVRIDGQIYENTPGDIGKGEPVRVISESGEMIALSYTSQGGTFKFSALSPDSKYNLKFNENSKRLKLNILKDGQAIPVPIKKNKAIYQRMKEEDAIDIIDDRGEQITIARDEVFNLQNIFYENNSSQLSEIAKFQLGRFSRLLFNNDKISVELISHTDSRGEKSYNFNLSQKRSKQAQEYLFSLGVLESQVAASGKGETELLNNCTDDVNCTEEEHATNRRTEIKIVIN
jgi:outer membrane protein OmpA-like peptidoglycan-associated protein